MLAPLGLIVLGACSSASTTAAGTTATTAATTSAAPAAPAAPPAAAPTDSSEAAAGDSAPPTPSTTTTLAPSDDPPLTGVPGAASADGFCHDYGVMVTTSYLVGLAEAFGDEAGARRAEVVAANSFIVARAGATEQLAVVAPDDAGGFDDRWGPYADRARAALDALVATGAGDVALDSVWDAILAGHDRNDPKLVIDLPAPVSEAVDRAATAFGAADGTLADSGALAATATVATPGVDAYVLAHCPDVAALTAGDAI